MPLQLITIRVQNIWSIEKGHDKIRISSMFYETAKFNVEECTSILCKREPKDQFLQTTSVTFVHMQRIMS